MEKTSARSAADTRKNNRSRPEAQRHAPARHRAAALPPWRYEDDQPPPSCRGLLVLRIRTFVAVAHIRGQGPQGAIA